MNKIKEHEQRVNHIVDLDRLAMVKGGSIGQHQEAFRKRKVRQDLIRSRQINLARDHHQKSLMTSHSFV